MSTEIILSPAPSCSPPAIHADARAAHAARLTRDGGCARRAPAHAVRGAASIVVTTDPAIYFKAPSDTCEREK